MKVARFNEIDDKRKKEKLNPSREAFLGANSHVPESPLDEDARVLEKEYE